MTRLIPLTILLAWPAVGVADEATPTASPAPEVKAEVHEEGSGLPVKLMASVEQRMLLITDIDPANDMSLLYGFGVAAKVFRGGVAFLRAGLSERFVSVDQESGFLLRDTVMGLKVSTPVALGRGHSLALSNQLSVFLPTSRASQKQDLYLATMLRSAVGYELLPRLQVTISPHFRYRFHQYAERAGTAGAMNTQLDFGVGGGVDYLALHSQRLGKLTVGLGASSTWVRRYPSRDDVASPVADRAAWFQQYGYDLHLSYAPIKYASLGVAIEQGGAVLRDGIVNTFLVKQEETEMVFTLSGRY